MFPFVLFTHLIAAMIYFAMPFSFGRWFASLSTAEQIAPLRQGLKSIRWFVAVYLNLCAVLILVTGVWMSVTRGYWHGFLFPHLSVALVIVSMLNINLLLLPRLRRFDRLLENGPPGSKDTTGLRRFLAVFSATHHTLVSIVTVLMVWKW